MSFEIHMQLVYSCAHTASSGICSSIYTQVIAGSTWKSSTCCTHVSGLCVLWRGESSLVWGREAGRSPVLGREMLRLQLDGTFDKTGSKEINTRSCHQ